MAGIPTAPGGEAGQRLRACLQNKPHEFVAVALREIHSAFGARRGRKQSGERKGAAEQDERRRRILEDIIYYWMLAEAYIQHPALQADMRCVCYFALAEGSWMRRQLDSSALGC